MSFMKEYTNYFLQDCDCVYFLQCLINTITVLLEIISYIPEGKHMLICLLYGIVAQCTEMFIFDFLKFLEESHHVQMSFLEYLNVGHTVKSLFCIKIVINGYIRVWEIHLRNIWN